MASKEKSSFLEALTTLLADRDSPSPIPEEIHYGLARERDLLCELYALCDLPTSLVTGGGDPVAKSLQAILSAVQDAAAFVRDQRAPTSHTWASNLMHAICHEDPSDYRERSDVLCRLDGIGIAWEAMVETLISRAGRSNSSEARYKLPFLHTSGPFAATRWYYTRRPGLVPVSFKNTLFAVCVMIDDSRAFSIPAVSSAALVQLSQEDVAASVRQFKCDSSSVRSKFFYIAAAVAVKQYYRFNDQRGSSKNYARLMTVSGDTEVSKYTDDEDTKALSLHVRRIAFEVWKTFTMSREEVCCLVPPMHEHPDLSLIHMHNRGRLRVPQVDYAEVFSVALRLSDVLFNRLDSMQPKVELPDEIVQVHGSVFRATWGLAEPVLHSVATRVRGWTLSDSQDLWRVFLRSAVLTSFRQLQRRRDGSVVDPLTSSSGSMRQVLTTIASKGAASSSKVSAACSAAHRNSDGQVLSTSTATCAAEPSPQLDVLQVSAAPLAADGTVASGGQEVYMDDAAVQEHVDLQLEYSTSGLDPDSEYHVYDDDDHDDQPDSEDSEPQAQPASDAPAVQVYGQSTQASSSTMIRAASASASASHDELQVEP